MGVADGLGFGVVRIGVIVGFRVGTTSSVGLGVAKGTLVGEGISVGIGVFVLNPPIKGRVQKGEVSGNTKVNTIRVTATCLGIPNFSKYT